MSKFFSFLSFSLSLMPAHTLEIIITTHPFLSGWSTLQRERRSPPLPRQTTPHPARHRTLRPWYGSGSFPSGEDRIHLLLHLLSVLLLLEQLRLPLRRSCSTQQTRLSGSILCSMDCSTGNVLRKPKPGDTPRIQIWLRREASFGEERKRKETTQDQ